MFFALLPWGNGQLHYVCLVRHCLGAVGNGTPVDLCNGALGSRILLYTCLTILGHRAVEILLCIASLPWGKEPWNSFCTLPHCLGVVGIENPSLYCVRTLGHEAIPLRSTPEQ